MKKHLTLNEREVIHTGLVDKQSLRSIAIELGRHPSTIANEIKTHRIYKNTAGFNRSYNPCLLRKACPRIGVCHGSFCQKTRCSKTCRNCYEICGKFVEEVCPRLSKSPYVCHRCTQYNQCTLTKAFYQPITAHKESVKLWKEQRRGMYLTQQDITHIDSIVSPLLKQGQSIHHILVHHQNQLMISSKTLYTLVHSGLLEARAIDCPRIVRFKLRKVKKTLKLDKNCLVGRSYEDYLSFVKEFPDLSVFEFDTVEGRKGGKVLLTINITSFDILLAFLRDHNDAHSVHLIFDNLKQKLGLPLYCQIFAIGLTDRGSEFTQPTRIEVNDGCDFQTKVFYCDPGRPQQKPKIENAHLLLRRILPKGSSFDDLTQQDIDLVVSHINSYSRKKLNNLSPYKLFSSVYPPEILQALNIREISPQKINLTPSLLR